MKARKHIAASLALAFALLVPAAAQADFGLQSESFSASATDLGGTADFQAGSHPYEYTVAFTMNQDSEENPEGILSDLVVELPPGLLGNPMALPRCKRADFDFNLIPACPGNTQIGLGEILFGHGTVARVGLFNLTPTPGSAATLGLSINNNNSFQEASLRSGSDYGISVFDITLPTNVAIQAVTIRVWGVPMDASHDDDRFCVAPNGQQIEGCSSDVNPPVPFMTLPASCTGPLQTTLRVGSVEGDTDSQTFETVDGGGEPTGLSGCNALEFKPTISSRPTTNVADAPTGLDFNLNQPQNQEPDDLATAAAKDVEVTLPEGMSLNPAAGDGLQACSEEQIGYRPSGGEIHFSEAPQSCPDAAKVGTLEVSSPPVDHKLLGSVYVANPYANPFGSLLAIYLAVEDPQTGIVAKLAGKVTPDPRTGQLTATFTDNPQLPLEDIDVHFFGGPRAALKTPLACGTYTTSSTLVPWSTPEGADATPSDSFQTSVAAGGGGICPKTEAQAPNKPAFTAGTLAPQAGAFSPFLLKLTRNDGSQRLTGIDVTLPKGLTGKLAGIPYCSEAQIAAAKSRERPNQGALEQASPSCPLASEVGSVTVGAGAGITPLYVGGHAYLAGPYKGAPISLVVIVPAVAGPFDLGAVLSRTAFYVNSETAQIHAVSDPLPSIIAGIPLDLRSVALKTDRPEFTLNPTSCDPTQITGSALALTGQSAALASPFQVGGCSALKFKPKLAISLKGGTKRSKNPALKAVLTYPKGGSYANIASAQVTLPHSAFLEQSHIGTVCTRVQFAADTCPKASVYGFARAFTPLLDKPVEGPVYLRSSSHELPDLVAALEGQVNVDLVGRVDTGKGGGIRNTFEAAPDAPVSKFVLEMQGGKKGLLVNSENICKKPQKALVSYTAQNGAAYEAQPLIKNDCGKKAKKKKKKDGKRVQRR